MVIDEYINASSTQLPELTDEDPAMILYTSGTTNKPKGVVLTHGNLNAQMNTLIHAWEWSDNDHTLCVLPLHHVHGIVNVVGCANRIGAICEFLPAFSAEKVFELFMKGEINVFMAVPTIYFKLIAYWETLAKEKQEALYNAMSKFRLMVCGSAALPVSIMEKWKLISGHTLLERYGMTEIGMGISNPYIGERRAGFVGQPLPGVAVRVVDESYNDIVNGEPGEILIKGANVFKSYWQKPDETEKAFTTDGWFKTGDMCVVENEYYKIIGRSSVDIIKSGGYKISALEIEEVLRTHESVKDCAVVALPDEEWGEKIVVAVVGKKPEDDSLLSKWIRTQLPNYKCPKNYIWVDELPRNAMGKVVKTDVKKLFN
jgi:malonyl-CoA/methylmalonyl-CoA synthetase